MGFPATCQAASAPQHFRRENDGPVLKISVGELQRRARQFLDGFPGMTTYAVKANAHPAIIRTFSEAGIQTFDVASIEEMQIVRGAVPHAVLHYHNPVRSRDEIATAYFEFGCRRFSVDHMSELEKIRSIVPDPSGVEIAVRFKGENASGAVQAFDSKFGASKDVAIGLIKQAKAFGFSVGLTFHPGSQIPTPRPYREHCRLAAEISEEAGLTPKFLNVGGGFPANYVGMCCASMERFFSEIEEECRICFIGKVPALECEPGRALVNSAGRLIATIKAVRHDKREIFLNDGIYGRLLEVSQFPTMQPAYGLDRYISASVDTAEWTVFGPTCDPIDAALPFKLNLPLDIAEGDMLRFQGIGAYSSATATRFNGYGSVQICFDQ